MVTKKLAVLLAASFSLVAALVTLRWRIRRTVTCKTRKKLNDKVVLVTGGSSGIGRAVAVECGRLGATVVLGCRDSAAGTTTVEEIRQSGGAESSMVLPLDLASFESVRNFVRLFLDQFQRLDVLINNAAYLGPKATTVDGLDYCFQVNFLSHFYLTNLLIRHFTLFDRLSCAHPMRVINMSSDAYVTGDTDFDDVTLVDDNRYDIYRMYATTKLAMILYTSQLMARYSSSGVKAVAVHPGAVKTGLTRNWPGVLGLLLRLMSSLLFRSPLEGSQSVLHCATTDDMDAIEGRLVADCAPVELEPIVSYQIGSERLWSVAEKLCRIDELSDQQLVRKKPRKL